MVEEKAKELHSNGGRVDFVSKWSFKQTKIPSTQINRWNFILISFFQKWFSLFKLLYSSSNRDNTIREILSLSEIQYFASLDLSFFHLIKNFYCCINWNGFNNWYHQALCAKVEGFFQVLTCTYKRSNNTDTI